MELFFLWLWLSLPAIFWAVLCGGLCSLYYMVISLVQWENTKKALDFSSWYARDPRTIYNQKEKQAAYDQYLFGRAAPGTPNPYKKLCVRLALVLLCWMAFVPSQKDVAILVGASYALDVAKSPEGAKVQTLLRSKVNEYLDNEIKTINQEKK